MKIEIRLKEEEREYLKGEREKGKITKRRRDRIEILLLCDKGKREKDIAEFLDIGIDKIWRVKRRYIDEGLESSLSEKARSGQPRKYTIKHETELTALACSDAPEGRGKWTLELLTEKMKEAVEGCDTMNRETIRLMLKKTNVSLG